MEVSLESINGRCAILGAKLCINDPDHARLLGTSGRDRKYFTDLEKALSNHIYHCFKTKMPVDRFSFCKCKVFRSSSYPLPNQQSRQAMPTVGMHARVSHVLNTGSSKYRRFSFLNIWYFLIRFYKNWSLLSSYSLIKLMTNFCISWFRIRNEIKILKFWNYVFAPVICNFFHVLVDLLTFFFLFSFRCTSLFNDKVYIRFLCLMNTCTCIWLPPPYFSVYWNRCARL